MGDLENFLLSGVVEFPDSGRGPWPLNWFPFIGRFVYILISAMYGGGAVSYGVAIIFFVVILKLMLLPMDFLNKYFTKKNANFMQKIKPEQDELKQQYANDPMTLNRATQELYKKHGYKMGGFCLFMFINLFVTMMIFFSVFGALRQVATHNVMLQVHAIQGVYQEFDGETDNPYFVAAINEAYGQHNVGFLWIRNIWREDVPWSSATLSPQQFVRHASLPEAITYEQLYAFNADRYAVGLRPVTKAQLETHILVQQYNAIIAQLEPRYTRSWNGLLILIILAGVTSWGSAYINAKIMLKGKAAVKPKEQVIEYSMRNTKNKADPLQRPQVDPVMMGRIMKIVLPAIMVYFTMVSTAGLAIYIIMNSILSTAAVVALNKPVDKLLKWQEQKREGAKPVADEEETVINPHAKYFKNKRTTKK